jgi:AraC family transcriptional activator of pobA
MPDTSLDTFYAALAAQAGTTSQALRPADEHLALGHCNIFDVAEVLRHPPVPAPASLSPLTFDRRSYYKISLIAGSGRATYDDQEIIIEAHSLWFATPQLSFQWEPDAPVRTGYLCVFTAEFLRVAPGPGTWEQLPLLQPGGQRVLEVSPTDYVALDTLFAKMKQVISSDFAYKYDLLRAYLLEVLYCGQQLQPAPPPAAGHSAAARLTAQFTDLLARQFPLASSQQQLRLRTARDFAQVLAVHPNHLNRVLQRTQQVTTTALIAERVAQEAKLLLRQTDWSLAEITDCLGFANVAHFSTFFKRQTGQTPGAFRG